MNPLVESRTRKSAIALNNKIYRKDVCFPEEESQNRSRGTSIQKRHGILIEFTLRVELGAIDRFKVWTPGGFHIPPEAEAAAQLFMNGATGDVPQVAYTGQGKLRQIDIMAFDRLRRRLSSLEIKRGTYAPDARAMRGIRREIIATQSVLPGFAMAMGLKTTENHARVVSYYGARCVPAPWSLTGVELDAYMECDLTSKVAEMTALFIELVKPGAAIPGDQTGFDL